MTLKPLIAFTRLAALAGVILCVSALGAHAEVGVAAPALHTAARARHHVRHHPTARHPRHHVVRSARFEQSRADGHVPLPARNMPQRTEHKVALPPTLHAARHSGASHTRHRHALAAGLTPIAMSVRAEFVAAEPSLPDPVSNGILRSGRAPPRAGPSTDAASSSHDPRPLFTPRPAAFPSSIGTEESPRAIRLPAGIPVRDLGAFSYNPFFQPEQPSGRSLADRPEGAAAWSSKPSS